MQLFQIPNPTKFDNIGEFLNRIVEFAVQIVGVIAVFYIILGGFKYITAGGNEKKAAEARASITSAIIGTIIVITSYLIVKFVLVNILNVNSSLLGDWLTN